MKLSNYHTHTRFCDGKDEPEELVLEALRLGCPELGFSGHSYVSFDLECCMSPAGTEEYVQTVRALQKKYRGRINIRLGVEQDFYSEASTEAYEYVIGSVHYLLKNGRYLPVDLSAESQISLVSECYGGDFYAFAEDYYDTVGRVYEKTRCDIIGHFDLVTKFNEGGCLFDTAAPRYRRAAMAALERLMDSPAVFEINTGAVSRGYRKEPYPEDFILETLKKCGKKLILSSDCHAKENLLFDFNQAKKLLHL